LEIEKAATSQMVWESKGNDGDCAEWVAFREKGYIKDPPRLKIPDFFAPDLRPEDVPQPGEEEEPSPSMPSERSESKSKR
jgi:hypothetical protein